MKRIMTIQDISCVGRCSITAALPVISAMGVECGILPTAVLSTHTMFQSFTCKDLSDQITPIADAWEKEGITFDGIYTGYLASSGQCAQVCDFIKRFTGDHTLVLVDPAMADNGHLYPAFDDTFPTAMASVCAAADIIVPNITEACLLTGMPYRTDYDSDYILELLHKLLTLGCKAALLTGVSFKKEELGAVYLDQDGRSYSYFTEYRPYSFHGTGDLYSAAFLGGVMRGLDPGNALALAVDFIGGCIDDTAADPDARWYGVGFEARIPALCTMLKERLETPAVIPPLF